MKIQENEIASIESFGMLDGKQVNLVKTKGGLNLATIKAGSSETVLGAASHQAILCYTIEQRFPSFQPMLMKSESGPKLEAVSHSHFLTDDLRKSGHDIYSVQNGNDVEFFVTQQNIKLSKTKGSIENDTLFFGPDQLPKTTDVDIWNAMCSAASEKALSVGLKKVRVK